MSKRTDRRQRDKTRRQAPARIEPAGGSPLARLLDSPHLTRIVPQLSAEMLHRVIQAHGLDACGPLMAASTPEQITSLLDLDLWQSAVRSDDRFDEQRFGSWLEVLMETGERIAARVVCDMDESLAVAGLSRFVRVFDAGVFEPAVSSDDDRGDVGRSSAGLLECEIGGYVVRAKTSDAWDAIVGLLVTIANERPDVFEALMRGCRRVSDSIPESDGLDELMLAPEQLLNDVAVGREDRRSQQGYLSAAEARAFLQLARQPRSRQSSASSTNTIAAAYFRALDDSIASGSDRARLDELSEGSSTGGSVEQSIEAIAELLAEPRNASARPRALLGPVGSAMAAVSPLLPLMEHVHDADAAAYVARGRELGFLANALVAGCSIYSRPFTAQEAWDAAVGICNVGLELSLASAAVPQIDASSGSTAALAEAFLLDHDLATVFEAGWRLLHEEVSLFVASSLIAALTDIRSVDPATQRDLALLRRDLERHRDAGTPSRAGEALEVLAILDTPAWVSLCGLLSECPVLPAAMTAIVDRHAGSVSATAFEFFSTRDQIRKVREFAARLRDALVQ